MPTATDQASKTPVVGRTKTKRKRPWSLSRFLRFMEGHFGECGKQEETQPFELFECAGRWFGRAAAQARCMACALTEATRVATTFGTNRRCRHKELSIVLHFPIHHTSRFSIAIKSLRYSTFGIMQRRMTLQEQAQQSGLFVLDEKPKWKKNNDWPPLEGGWRLHHASVVLNPCNHDNKKGQTAVVLGGNRKGHGATNSVLLLNLAEPHKKWREGPPMNKRREGHAAVVCNGGVYVMGGYNGASSSLDCVERMDAKDMLHSSTTTTNSSKKSHWTILNCKLLAGRHGCFAVAVRNRYIVDFTLGQTGISRICLWRLSIPVVGTSTWSEWDHP